MNHTDFQRVQVRRTVSGPCMVCGVKIRRSKTFWQTVNPWNKNPDGSTRTGAEVHKAVEEQADRWQPVFIHAKCQRDAA